jgi:hypothetical protein
MAGYTTLVLQVTKDKITNDNHNMSRKRYTHTLGTIHPHPTKGILKPNVHIPDRSNAYMPTKTSLKISFVFTGTLPKHNLLPSLQSTFQHCKVPLKLCVALKPEG